MNLHQYVKNQAFSSFCSRDIVSLKILQSDWLTAFWPMSQEPEFFQVQDFCKNTANIIENPVLASFLANFPYFGGKKNFSWKIWLSRTTSYGFLAPCKNLEKVNDTIQRKYLDRRKDGQTLFYRTLPATARGLKRDKHANK